MQDLYTSAIPLQSEVYTFLPALNRRVRELVQEDHLDANRLNSSDDDGKIQIMNVLDERNGTIRLLMNRATRYSKNVFVPCEMEDSGEPRQIFQIENTQRLHISVNLQHIWGLSSNNKTNHTKHSIDAPFHILISILVVEQ